ncbi:hypothetical protein [Haliovirga abyssi]|uniref:DUF4468 domain-containing protein n=1 Tax=Haliovirga abyssi TaxID=2996794 RepID=A0AAU9DDA5_9FUSO|nr:hypothetical protein [Haliovirga abyssi]BDU50153.1 hypothetical protein HLVA_07220 [Haliovirga abyssi]
MKKIILIISYIYFFNILYSQELKLKNYNMQLKNILKIKSLNEISNGEEINENIKKTLNLKVTNSEMIDYYKNIFNKNKLLMSTYEYYRYYYKYYEKGIILIQNYKNKILILRGLDIKVEGILKGKINYSMAYRFKIYFDLEKIIKGELRW